MIDAKRQNWVVDTLDHQTWEEEEEVVKKLEREVQRM